MVFPWRIHMIVIGIAGGIASGKSLVADQFRKLGAVVLSADQAGHRVLRERKIKDQIRSAFGFAEEKIFDEGGEIIRSSLASIVFHPEHVADLRKLEGITHPRIRELLEEQLETIRSTNCLAAVLDAPVMFKSGWDNFCDVVVFVDTPFEVRLHRAEQRDWPDGELQRREAMQISLDEKRLKSDFVISNSSSTQHTFEQVKRIWDKLILLPPTSNS